MENRYMYHYTSTEGFFSIINNHSLRFTHSKFLNDPQDCKIFFEIIQDYLDTIVSDDGLDIFIKKNCRQMDIEAMHQLLERFTVMGYLKYIHDKMDMYVLSMTSSDDLLPMWNYYGGEGMQICFNTNELMSALRVVCCKKENQYIACSKVNYISEAELVQDLCWDTFNNINVHYKNGKYIPDIIEDKKGRLNFFVDSFVKSYVYNLDFLINDIYPDMEDNELYKKIFIHNRQSDGDFKFKKDVDLYMLLLGAFHKPKTYENEQEVRLIYLNCEIDNDDDVNYLVSRAKFGSYIRPYMEFKIEGYPCFGNAIHSVLLSPIVKTMPIQQENYSRVVQDFLKERLGCDIKVGESCHRIRW